MFSISFNVDCCSAKDFIAFAVVSVDVFAKLLSTVISLRLIFSIFGYVITVIDVVKSCSGFIFIDSRSISESFIILSLFSLYIKLSDILFKFYF